MQSLISKNSWVLITIIGIAAIIGFSLKTSVPAPTATIADAVSGGLTTNFQFVNHFQANVPEQDVFSEKSGSKTQVVRAENSALQPAMLSKNVFATTNALTPDPFKLSAKPLGPFPKGRDLGITLNDWLAASGSGTYTANGNNSKIIFSFQKLIPNGSYNAVCSKIGLPPNFSITENPCVANDEAKSSFTADAQGNAQFKAMIQALPSSDRETDQEISIVYRSDNQSGPRQYGVNAHTQLFYVFPAPESDVPQQQ